MLVEYALVPDVLDSTCYSSPELCEASLQILKPILLEEAPVRDLRGGRVVELPARLDQDPT